jgi:CHAD domain-containing protein
MHELDPLVRRDEADAVHQLRVTTRRLRSLLASYRRLLDTAVTEPLRDELRLLAEVLGGARDPEVMLARLQRTLDDEDPGLVRLGTGQHVAAELSGEHDRARARVARALESPRYASMLDDLDQLAADPPWREVALRSGRKPLRKAMRKEWRRLSRRVDALEAGADDDRTPLLHEVRKAARRARFAAEVLEPAWPHKAHRLAKHLKRLQSVLGEHHDSVVTQAKLRDLAASAAAAGKDGFTLGVLHVRAEQSAASLERAYAVAWHRASRSRLRRWLK